MLEHDIKKTSIFDFPKNNHWEYDLSVHPEFSFPFPEEVGQQVIRYYAEYAGGPVFNRPVACLAGIEPVSEYTTNISLESGEFYSFVLANVVGREVQGKSDKLLRAFSAFGAPSEVVEAAAMLGTRFKEAQETIKKFTDCCSNPLLPNVVAVSVLVHDRYGNFLVSQRTRNVLIGKDLGGVTSTGTLEPMDCFSAARKDRTIDPFGACAQRELTEETEFKNLPDEAFKTRGLFIGKAKLQPIAIVDVVVEDNLFGYSVSEPCGSSESEPELKKITAVPRERLQPIVFKYDMTEAASYHMLMHIYDDQ